MHLMWWEESASRIQVKVASLCWLWKALNRFGTFVVWLLFCVARFIRFWLKQSLKQRQSEGMKGISWHLADRRIEAQRFCWVHWTNLHVPCKRNRCLQFPDLRKMAWLPVMLGGWRLFTEKEKTINSFVRFSHNGSLGVCFLHEGPQKSMSLFTRSFSRDFVDPKFKTSPNAVISTIIFSSVSDVCTFGMSIFNIKDSEYGGMMFVHICDGFLCF